MSSCVHVVLAYEFLAAVCDGELQHMWLIVHLAKIWHVWSPLLKTQIMYYITQTRAVQLNYLNVMVTKLPAKTQYAYYKSIKKAKTDIKRQQYSYTVSSIICLQKWITTNYKHSFLGGLKIKHSYAKPGCIYLIKLQSNIIIVKCCCNLKI